MNRKNNKNKKQTNLKSGAKRKPYKSSKGQFMARKIKRTKLNNIKFRKGQSMNPKKSKLNNNKAGKGSKSMNRKTNRNKKQSGAHDYFFKEFFSKPHFTKELLPLFLSKKQISHFNLKSLKIEKDSFPGNQNADLVFSISFKKTPKVVIRFFILLEHKSYYDKNLYSQLLGYQYFLRAQCLKDMGKAMPIIPVVFYHGKQKELKWKNSLQEEDFKPFFKSIPLEFKDFMLDYKIKWINLNEEGFEKIFKDKRVKGRAFLRLLKEIWYVNKNPSVEDFREIFKYFEPLLRSLGKKAKRFFLLRVLWYLTSNGIVIKGLLKNEKLREALENLKIIEKGEDMGIMDLYDEKLRKEGIRKGRKEGLLKGQEKGRQEGRQQLILNMLKKKADISFISEVTGLSIKEIKKLKNGA